MRGSPAGHLELTAQALAAAGRAGLRQLGLRVGGQNIVLEARYQRRVLIAKARLAVMSRRLDKERSALLQARVLGVPCPRVLGMIHAEPWSFLLLSRGKDDGQVHNAQRWAQDLKPLHHAPCPPGWGFLRADGQARWRDANLALPWYSRLASDITLSAPSLCQLLHATWPHRHRAFIHGDPHQGNRCGSWIVDWECLAIGDPLEDAAALALAQAWPWERTCVAFGGDPSSPRAQGAWLRSRLEAAAYPGPRQAEALRQLGC